MLPSARANKKGPDLKAKWPFGTAPDQIARASNTVRVHRIPPRVRDDRERPSSEAG